MWIFERNYMAIIDRGVKMDTKYDFIEKIKEEYEEFQAEITVGPGLTDSEAEELSDLINTACNLLIFSGRNPEAELEKIAIKNENRAINKY